MTSRPHEKHPHRRKAAHAGPKRQRTDIVVYIVFVMVGLFAVPLAVLFTGWGWRTIAVGYVAAMAILVNVFTAKACFGGKLTGWEKPMARVSLRFVGYGAEMDKPLSAARHDPRARLALVMSMLVSVLIVGGLYLLLVR